MSSPHPAFGVYVHFPWCHRRCPYCDFAIAVARRGEPPHDLYADAVLAELAARAPRFAGRALASVYFGGGTPALWRVDALARVLCGIRDAFVAGAEPIEVTVEANPNDCTPTVLTSLRRAGVNRISIGAQAFDDDALAFLGRDHDAAQAGAAVATARDAGIAHVSLDLIYGLPGDTGALARFRGALATAVGLAPDHLSVYQLTVEERSTFGAAARKGRLAPATADDSARAFVTAHEQLSQAGYEHYEVSSYARPGAVACHNSLYWSGAEYLGLGCAAHSFLRVTADQGMRWSSHRSVVRYLAGHPTDYLAPIAEDPLVAHVDARDAAGLLADALWLGLRTSQGVPRALAAGRERELDRLGAAGLIEEAEGRIRPTARGLLFADEIGARLL